MLTPKAHNGLATMGAARKHQSPAPQISVHSLFEREMTRTLRPRPIYTEAEGWLFTRWLLMIRNAYIVPPTTRTRHSNGARSARRVTKMARNASATDMIGLARPPVVPVETARVATVPDRTSIRRKRSGRCLPSWLAEGRFSGWRRVAFSC